MTPYRVRRSRRKTIAIHILPDGQVEVRAPLRTSPKFLDRFVQEKAEWIEKPVPKPEKGMKNGRHLY